MFVIACYRMLVGLVGISILYVFKCILFVDVLILMFCEFLRLRLGCVVFGGHRARLVTGFPCCGFICYKFVLGVICDVGVCFDVWVVLSYLFVRTL